MLRPEASLLVREQRREHVIRSQMMPIDGNVPAWRGIVRLAQRKERAYAALLPGKSVMQVILRIVRPNHRIVDPRTGDTQPCDKIAVLRLACCQIHTCRLFMIIPWLSDLVGQRCFLRVPLLGSNHPVGPCGFLFFRFFAVFILLHRRTGGANDLLRFDQARVTSSRLIRLYRKLIVFHHVRPFFHRLNCKRTDNRRRTTYR